MPPLANAVEICGSAMLCLADDIDGAPLVLRRHRLFASSHCFLVPSCACAQYRRLKIRIGGVYGNGPANRAIEYRDGRLFGGGYVPTPDVRRKLMGCEWMTGEELSQAIPPAYTEHLGHQLMAHLKETAHA